MISRRLIVVPYIALLNLVFPSGHDQARSSCRRGKRRVGWRTKGDAHSAHAAQVDDDSGGPAMRDAKMDGKEGKRAVDDDIKADEPWCCYRDKSGVLMCSGVDCNNWGWIALAFFAGYGVLAMLGSIFIVAEFSRGLDVLWAFLAIYVAFVVALTALIIAGEVHRSRERHREAEERKTRILSHVVKHH